MNLARTSLLLFEADVEARRAERRLLADPGDTEAAQRSHRNLVRTGRDHDHMAPLVKNALDARKTLSSAENKHRTTVAQWVGDDPNRFGRFRGVGANYAFVHWDRATDAHDLDHPDSKTEVALAKARQDQKQHRSKVRRAASLMGEPVGKYHPRMISPPTKNGVLRHVDSMRQLAGGASEAVIRHSHPHLNPISTSHQSWFGSEQDAKDHAAAIQSHDLPGKTKMMQKSGRWGVHFTPHKDLETA